MGSPVRPALSPRRSQKARALPPNGLSSKKPAKPPPIPTWMRSRRASKLTAVVGQSGASECGKAPRTPGEKGIRSSRTCRTWSRSANRHIGCTPCPEDTWMVYLRTIPQLSVTSPQYSPSGEQKSVPIREACTYPLRWRRIRSAGRTFRNTFCPQPSSCIPHSKPSSTHVLPLQH